jgi:hypothetical protein
MPPNPLQSRLLAEADAGFIDTDWTSTTTQRAESNGAALEGSQVVLKP